ncbi:DMT family transporter [Streptomyces uncialis]|uniref:DMT family transporter n=1 Tax=Streptomyces uncialis TaxID=1048205 RepID=UPI003791F59A
MSGFVFAVALCLVSAVAYAGGAIVQERVAVSTPGRTAVPVRRPLWWGAVGLNGVGAVLHVLALAYGPLSLVQPLGALTIVFALPMAAFLVRRRAGATAWRGALMATIGLAGLLSLTSSAGEQSMNGAERLVLALVTAGALVTLTVAAQAAHRHPAVRSVLLASAAGVAFGIGSVFTKAVALDWTEQSATLDIPSLAVIAALATAGMFLSQSAYRGAGLAAPLSTVTVVNPVVAAAVGLTLLGESFRYGSAGTVLALGCGVVAAGGLILLTTERIGREQQESAALLDEAVELTGGPAAAGEDSATGTDRPVVAEVADGAGGPSLVFPVDERATMPHQRGILELRREPGRRGAHPGLPSVQDLAHPCAFRPRTRVKS